MNDTCWESCEYPFTAWEASKDRLGQELFELVAFVLSVVSQSATCERLLSLFGFFQKDLRNRLGSEKMHDLQEVKRSMCEKYCNEEHWTSKIISSLELDKVNAEDGHISSDEDEVLASDDEEDDIN